MQKRDRLAQLAVPRAEGQRTALEPGQFEIGAKKIGAHGRDIRRLRARHRLTHRAKGGPGGIIAGVHATLVRILEAGLKLRGAPLFDGWPPCFGREAFGADNRARLPRVVHHVAPEIVQLVGDDKRVVVAKLLREERNLLRRVPPHIGIEAPFLSVGQLRPEFGE